MGPGATAKNPKRRIVQLAFVHHLVRHGFQQDCRGQGHVEEMRIVIKRLAPEVNRQARAIQHGNDMLFQHAVLALSNAPLLQHALNSVLMLNAALGEVSVPNLANVFAALVIVQAPNLGIVPKLDIHLERFKHFKDITFLLQQPDPAIPQPVINEGDPVSKAQDGGNGHHVHIQVDTLKDAHGAVQSFGRKWVAVVLANNAQLAMQRQWRVAIDAKAVGKLVTNGSFQRILSNVAKTVVPKGAIKNGLSTQGALGGLQCMHIEPGGVLADCCSEHVLAIAQEVHQGALNLNAEAGHRDKVQDGEEIVLEQQDV
jgi:hypothetical protein